MPDTATKNVVIFNEFVEEFELLHGQGFTRVQIAERLGMTRDAVDKRIERIRKSERQETAA